MIERRDCPHCGYVLHYVWASAHADPVVDEALNRFQECRHSACNMRHGRYQADVLTGVEHTFQRTDNGRLIIDGKPYRNIGEWVLEILLRAE